MVRTLRFLIKLLNGWENIMVVKFKKELNKMQIKKKIKKENDF